MTFSRKLTMWKPLHFLNTNSSQAYFVPILIFVVFLLQGSTLGLSDDEAYYWVLAQKPSLGYAFHPPAVAWLIWVSEALLKGIVTLPSPGVVRFPAALTSAWILISALRWLEDTGVNQSKLFFSSLVLVSYTGFFSLSWMMVPDIPLFIGWTLLFTQTWKICFYPKLPFSHYGMLGGGAALILLSKYSGVLAIFSSAFAILKWSPQKRKRLSLVYLSLGLCIALIPIVVWNSQHQWASILYQVHKRHAAASVSFERYLKFWLIEIILAGPVLIFYFFKWVGTFFLGKRQISDLNSKILAYSMIWILPAAFIFCVQPLFSEFKPHWALIVWWPVALAFTWQVSQKFTKWVYVHMGFGLSLIFLVLMSCHYPLVIGLYDQFSRPSSQHSMDPRLDVTNDFYGWNQFASFLKQELSGQENLKIVGSRYQTASQIAFSVDGLKFPPRVTLLPRDQKEMDEWPDLKISQTQGPNWPRLLQPVLFVSDNRYDSAPKFPNATCRTLKRLEAFRFGKLAKWIDVWRCDPRS